jgi:putative phage-type endonuclease
MMPKFLNLEQGSSDWLEWRKGGIGCSEVATILEEDPWESAYGLWQLKCGFKKPRRQTAAMARGNQNEVAAREWYVRGGSDVIVKDARLLVPVTVVYDDCDYLRASIDGWDDDHKHGVEIKCPSDATLLRQAKEGHIPYHYLLQMWGEMEILDAASWDYCVWYEGDGCILPVERNSELWAIEILPTLVEFWRRVEMREWPRPNGRVIQESAAWNRAVADLFQAKETLRVTEEHVQNAMARLKRMMGTAKYTDGGGARARWEEWRPRYTIEMTFDDSAARDVVLDSMLNDLEHTFVRDKVRKDKETGEPTIYGKDFPPNLVFKVEAKS